MAVKDWAFCTSCHATAYGWNHRTSKPEQTETQRDLDIIKEWLRPLSLGGTQLGEVSLAPLYRTVIRLAEKEE
jgi:hypothetical protein